MDRSPALDSFEGRPSGGSQVIPRPPGARRGGPAPWHDLAPLRRRIELDEVRETFARVGPPVPSPREGGELTRAAAVLAPLYAHEGDTWVVLTRRTMRLRAHRGEVSFPGGGQDPGEVLLDTALREAREEVSLDPSSVEVVGELDHLSTITSGSFIVPYVGVLPERPRNLRANPAEVDAILHVRLRDLLEPAAYHEERWPLFGAEHPIVFFDLPEDTLWGATAAMLRQLLGLVTGTVGRGELGHV